MITENIALKEIKRIKQILKINNGYINRLQRIKKNSSIFIVIAYHPTCRAAPKIK